MKISLKLCCILFLKVFVSSRPTLQKTIENYWKQQNECSCKLSLLTSTVLGLGAYDPHKDINLKSVICIWQIDFRYQYSYLQIWQNKRQPVFLCLSLESQTVGVQKVQLGPNIERQMTDFRLVPFFGP